MPPNTLLEPSVLTAISHLELIAKKAVEGAVSGLHHSQYKGRNIEFSEHRPYNPGDELRYIDWRVYAKSDRFHVKQYEEDTNLRATLLVDISGSMKYEGEHTSKINYARQIAAAFSYLILKQGDSVGMLLFDDAVRQFVPSRQRQDQWVSILQVLGESPCSDIESKIGNVLSSLGEYVKKRGLVIIVSDLIDQPEAVLKNLSLLRMQNHEVVVFHVLAPEEIEMPYYGTVEFFPLEGGNDPFQTSPRKLQKNYQSRVQQFIEHYRNGCLELGVDYQLVRTDKMLENVLREYLQKRMKR